MENDIKEILDKVIFVSGKTLAWIPQVSQAATCWKCDFLIAKLQKQKPIFLLYESSTLGL